MSDVIYFEFNDWSRYPNAEPFISWMRWVNTPGWNWKFRDIAWVKENRLVVCETIIDQSVNFCVTAPFEWVKNTCPELLTKYSEYIRHFKDDQPKVGRFGSPFLDYTEENIGYHEFEDFNDNCEWREIHEGVDY